MRPARGRPQGPATRRACVVRVEKIQPPQARQMEVTEDDRKKMTGPLKKRPVVLKKSPGGTAAARQTRRRGVNEDLSEYMLVTARAKRTPKPNPKYSNEDIVTPRARSKEAPEDSEAEDEDVYQSSEMEEPQDESSEEEFEPNKPVTRGGVIRLENGELVKRGPGRPPKLRADMVTPKQAQKRRLEANSDGKADFETILAQNKRLNIELYDASDSDISVATPTRRIVRSTTSSQSLRSISRLATAKTQQKEPQKRFLDRRRAQQQSEQQRRRLSTDDDEDDPAEYETTGVASTLDDFETMPTFTIVNINDIINKKGDVMIEQTNRVNNNVSTSNNNNQSATARGEDTRISPNQSSRNRRKSMHTTILSDKIDPDALKNPPPRSPFPPRKPVSPHNSLNQCLSTSLLSNNQPEVRSAPRILNNVLCRRTKVLQAQQEQRQQQQQQHQLKQQKQVNQRVESRSEIQSKENHLNDFRPTSTRADALTPPTHNPLANRKLPNSKVVVQRQGNKIIRKITCFETWHVINIPNEETLSPPQHLDIPLMHLANTANEIVLPSDEWSFKVNLQKITPAQLNKMSQVFTGEVQDSNISESEKHNYMPVSVMFRRLSNNQKHKMPFDRAVIFKHESYYTNIDGKNVRLIGCPQNIASREDIGILLQIVDAMTLASSMVEQVTYEL